LLKVGWPKRNPLSLHQQLCSRTYQPSLEFVLLRMFQVDVI
jgi:hypothetical protein